jgi:hypothetical protein
MKLPIIRGMYRTRNGKTASAYWVWGSNGCYIRGVIQLKTKTVERTWNTNDGTKVCYSNHGNNGDDLIEGPL